MLELGTIKEKLCEESFSLKTLDIKKLFADLCTELKYSVYANGDPNYNFVTDNQEFLYDLISVKEENFDYAKTACVYITKTFLSLESELVGTFKLVLDDFLKLLISNSEFKIMVFKCHSEKFEEWTNYMKSNICKYKNSNGTFFLIGFLNDKIYETNRENRFKIEQVTCNN